MKSIRAGTYLVLLLAVLLRIPVAQAGFSVGGTLSALPGEQVEVILNDSSVSGLEALDLLVTFDPAMLTFNQAALGSVWPTGDFGAALGGPATPAAGQLLFTISVGTEPVSNTVGSLLHVTFTLKNPVPALTTLVTFESVPGSESYLVPSTFGTVTAVPEPGTWLTMLAGLGLLAASALWRSSRAVTANS